MGLGSGVAVSCGVGFRCGLDPKVLWLWCRSAAVAPIWPLPWELPYAEDAALKSSKKKKKKRIHFVFFFFRNTIVSTYSIQYILGTISICWIHELRCPQISYDFNLHSNPLIFIAILLFNSHSTDETTEALGCIENLSNIPQQIRGWARTRTWFVWVHSYIKTMQPWPFSARRNQGSFRISHLFSLEKVEVQGWEITWSNNQWTVTGLTLSLVL